MSLTVERGASLVESLTFQIWLLCVVIGLAVAITGGGWLVATIMPWVGMFIGMGVNELLNARYGAGAYKIVVKEDG